MIAPQLTVKKQKDIADNIFTKLKIVDPYCILAGGAPRDWYFGTPANDLDFYFTSVGTTCSAVMNQLGSLFDGVTLLMDKEGYPAGRTSMYKTMPFLKRIWEVAVDGMPVQLIELSGVGNQFRVVDYMDISICQISYHNGQIKKHKNFKLTEISGIMFTTKDDYAWEDAHPMKICDRFKGKFVIGTKKQAENCVIRKALEAV